MRITIVHGYFLHDSGSAIYARELAREFTGQGHEVTLVCQDQEPERCDFIDSVYELDADNSHFQTIYERDSLLSGSCRLVRPHLGGHLLTYVSGPFPGFDAVPLQDATTGMINAYVVANTRALSVTFERWGVDLVQANHVVMQPFVVGKALSGRAPYLVTVHGSELNFTIRNDPRMVPYAITGLEEAAAVFALSQTSVREVVELAAAHGLDIVDKTKELPPGVDTGLFSPVADRVPALQRLCPTLKDVGADIAVFAGRLLWTKGLQYAVAALPLLLQERPGLNLLVAGDGPMKPSLERFTAALDRGDLSGARDMTLTDPLLQAAGEYGPVWPELAGGSQSGAYAAAARDLARRIHFLGHLNHEHLAQLFTTADISLAPSVFPEAFGLVSIEAAAAGALPLATYQTGLMTPLDAVAGVIDDATLVSLKPGILLTPALAEAAACLLDGYPTRELEFRQRLHRLAASRFSWASVAGQMLASIRPPAVS
ncbi:MAG: glycosyltransferase family 4 protein [Thermoleophilia bacterium]